MAVNYIGNCQHILFPSEKKFGRGGKTLFCLWCNAEMLDCPENRDRFCVAKPEPDCPFCKGRGQAYGGPCVCVQ